MIILTPIFCLLLILGGEKTNPSDPINPQLPLQEEKEEQKPGSKTEWFNFQPLKNLSNEKWGEYLTDIENHVDPRYGLQYRSSDYTTWSHESSHGIHAYLNNTHNKVGERTYYHLYVGYNKAVKIKQPNIRISHVANIVPDRLRKSRFNLYLVQQRGQWDKEPIYIWDEWVAYCNGIECGIEQVNKHSYNPAKNDSCWSVLEFGVYATYVAIAQKKHDPDYDNKQLLEFLAWNLERSMTLYYEGIKLPQYNWDGNQYLEQLRTGNEAAEFRNFLTSNYGTAWTKRVMGF